jgi:hypothetical protein
VPSVSPLSRELTERVRGAVGAFTFWLEGFGESSFDHQSYYAGPIGRRAKSLYYSHKLVGTLAVAPMVFSEALLPAGRRLFGTRVRFPIADAHYAMGFAFLAEAVGDSNHQKSVGFLRALERSRCPGYPNYCWGYPFDWVTRNGILRANTPFITSTPYAYEAFRLVFELDGDNRWLDVNRSIARHAVEDIADIPVSDSSASCGYYPGDRVGGVVNAAAYRSWLLAAASQDLSDERYWAVGVRNLNFVLNAQRPDGSWHYSVHDGRDFVDHFHTCFVLKALAKIDGTIDAPACGRAIDSGVEYYLAHLLDSDGLPKPFSKAPRLTVYRRELYDYAECINVCLLLRQRLPVLQRTLANVLEDLLARWLKEDGSFRSRELLVGWDNVPMHRWAQSQMFRSLSFYLREMDRARSRTTPDYPTTAAELPNR